MRGGVLVVGLVVLLPVAARAEVKGVGLENQYADVMAQIGGPYAQVSAIETDPNTDPHEFEISPKVASALAGADVVVENGLGYDSWADKMLAGGPAKVISAQAVMGLPDSTLNPHLWYRPGVMAAVAAEVAAAFAAKDPAHAAMFQANLQVFDESLKPWADAVAALKAAHAGADVAVTEPVGDYLAHAAGLTIATPWALEAAIMNGTDPAPQDVATEEALLADGGVKAFLYNEQVTDPLTQHFLEIARAHHVPVVGVYETMPAGTSYQGWMLAETQELAAALDK